MLSEILKARIRMHLGVPVAGIPDTGSALGYRFNNQVGTLEYRMINLQPIEEAQLTGAPTAVAQIVGLPQVGDVVTVTIGANAPIPYTVTAADVAAPIPVESISQNLAQKVTLANQGYFGDFGLPPQTKPFGGNQSYTGTLIITPLTTPPTPFTVAVSTTGNTIPFVAQQGIQIPPTVTFAESNTTVYGYVAICDYLEARIANASDLAKFTQTDVVRYRQNELAERTNIYDAWCQRLADFLGISRYPMGRPAAPGSAAFTGAIG